MRMILSIVLAAVAVSCQQSNEAVDGLRTRVTVTAIGLPRLESAHYELWVAFHQFNRITGGDSPAHEGEYVSLGEFNVGADDALVHGVNGGNPYFALPQGSNPQLLKDVVISIHVGNAALGTIHDDEPGSIIVGGAFRGDERTAVAELNIAYADAFKTDFASATGRCTVVAPTSPADSNGGIWFVETVPAITAGLRNLPALPRGWQYEGWIQELSVVAPGGPGRIASTGKFDRADTADSDGAGSGRGTQPPMNYPGQDFVSGTFRPNLMSPNWGFKVTIEPNPDISESPFTLTLLEVNRMTAPQPQSRTLTMNNSIASSAPTARVVVQR